MAFKEVKIEELSFNPFTKISKEKTSTIDLIIRWRTGINGYSFIVLILRLSSSPILCA